MNFREHRIDWNDVTVSRLWNYYSRTAPQSGLYFSKLFGDDILRATRLPLGDALRVLDFGSGPGFLWDHLQRMGSRWTYTGLDFSSDSVDALRRKAEGHACFGSALAVTGLPAELPASQFDAALMIEVVEHLDDARLGASLDEVSRLLKPGGALVITTPNEEDLAQSTKFCPDCGAIFHEWQHVRSWSVRGLANSVCPHGFQLRFAQALDFAARARLRRASPLRRLLHLVRSRFGRPAAQPHLIAVFERL